jgi:hypothetical protein|tara:strand:+ start:371 stop:571 length:201 start_codon:yes stop_codon:yes gene_type:complete
MQVTITFAPDCEDDGFSGSTEVVRNEVVDLYDLGRAYGDAARAAGYTYVEDVAFEKDDGTMVFCGW